MPLLEPALNEAVDGATGVLAFASLHSAAPNASGSNEVTGGGYARQPVVWNPATGAVAAANGTLSFTGPPGSPATHVGLWSALSGGTWFGGEALTGDQTFNSQGQYDVTALTVTATSS